jgi:hypothetical protein
MTPFGKPAAEVTLADLQKLIADAEPEGRHIEYKEDVPVSDERTPQRKAGDAKRRDRSWTKSSSLMDYGRDRLMRELVAFANADGGMLVLGIVETDEKPARAAGYNPLPQVAALEGRLRNLIIDCIEPRLPYAAVKAIPTESDGTSGVVVLEIEPSRLGPHWVRTSREATIRREDSCSPLTMPEIHAMTIRNARRFDDIAAVLRERSERFANLCQDTLARAAGSRVHSLSIEGKIDTWLSTSAFSAFAVRITVVPHQDLGISRLENYHSLIPPHKCTTRLDSASGSSTLGSADVWLERGPFRRLLGGVEIARTNKPERGDTRYTIKRDGFVEFSWIRWGARDQTHLHAHKLVSALGCTLGVYSLLRKQSNSLAMPAEVSIEILTFQPVCVTHPNQHNSDYGQPLDSRVMFDRRAIGQIEDFSEVMNESGADLMNAADYESATLAKYAFVEP